MHALLSAGALLVPLLTSTPDPKEVAAENGKRYVCLSRFTDPKGLASLLDELPDDVQGILDVVKRQVIHPDHRTRFGVPLAQWKKMKVVWPPRVADVLKALQEAAPHNLNGPRPPEKRVVGACIVRSYLLAA